MSLSPDQIAIRLAGVSATDVAAIIGVHPHRSAVDVWMSKKGKAPPFLGNERTKWGEILERPIRRDYEERHQVVVQVPGTLTHVDFPWMVATPDGIVYQSSATDPCWGLEIKCHTVYLARDYGAPGTDEVPHLEIVQCAWNMAVTGLDRWDLVVFMDGLPRDYRIDRDDELIAMLVEKAERFLVDNVQGDRPPAPDGTDAYDAWLAARYAAENALAGLKSIDGNPELVRCALELRKLREVLTQSEAAEKLLEQEIKAEIGDLAGVEFTEFGRKKPSAITWKRPKDSSETDHEAIAAEMRAVAALVMSAKGAEFERALLAIPRDRQYETSRGTMQGLDLRELITVARDALADIANLDRVRKHTKAVPGSRRFLVPSHWNKDGK